MMRKHVVILPWGNEIEDYLEPIGLDIDAFCTDMTGGWLFGYADALALRGWHVTIVCISRATEKRQVRKHLSTGADVVVVPSSRFYRAIRAMLRDVYAPVPSGMSLVRRLARSALRTLAPYSASRPLALLREMRKLKPTALLCQEYEYARFDVMVALAKLLGVRSGATFQGGQETFSGLEGRIRHKTIAMCDALFVGSARERDRLAHRYDLAGAAIKAVPNPIDLRTWALIDREKARRRLGWAADERIAICHGRIDLHRKGLDVLLAAWSVVAPKDERFRLVIVGDGVDADRLAALIETTRPARLTWLREFVRDRDQIACLLQAADLYVMASRQEGFPVAPLEAMASSLPVILSDAPGCSDILEGAEGEVGAIVVREHPAQLADQLERLLSDPSLSAAWGRNARTHVASRFSPERIGVMLDEALGA